MQRQVSKDNLLFLYNHLQMRLSSDMMLLLAVLFNLSLTPTEDFHLGWAFFKLTLIDFIRLLT
ncbi:hypothetical protein CWR41_04655 [Cedecea lapagei]|nr:hypothetical protein CWR41_04655 [Cedecea lapagei]